MTIIPDTIFGLQLSTWLFRLCPAGMIVYTVSWMIYTLTLHPLAKVPGPFWASVTRLWYLYRIHVGDMDQVQRALHKKYGPLLRIAPNEVSSASAADIPKIYRLHDPLLKTDFYSPWSAPQISKQRDQFSIIDEEEHKRYRRIIGPVYSLGNVLKHEDYVAKCTTLFLERMKEFAENGQQCDLGHWLQMYSFDVVGELMFGDMFGFMEKSIDIGGWIAALESLIPVICMVAIAPKYMRPVIMGSAICLPSVSKALRSFDGVRKAAVNCVNKRIEDINAKKATRIDMLQQLNAIREKGEALNFTDSEVKLEAYVAMLAGSDTTATALRATLYYLMRNPEKLARCRKEIDAHHTTLSSPIRFTESIAQLPYTGACIKEAMRLFPSVGLNMPRYSPTGGLQVSGHYVPSGYRVGCNPSTVQYDKTVFGEDADEFQPERWIESEERSRDMEKGLLTFGGGTRGCIGKNIALTQLHTIVPEIIRNFDISMAHNRPWKTWDRWSHSQTDVIINVGRR